MKLGLRTYSASQTSGSVSVATKWVHSIDRGKDFDDVLKDFRNFIGASAVQIVRQMRGIERSRLIARQEASAGKLFARAPRSFAAGILGELLHKTNLGNFFLFSDIHSEHEVRSQFDKYELCDAGIVSLCRDDGSSDFLEFHFERPLLEHNRQLLELLSPNLSQSWCDRTPGMIATQLAKNPFPTAQESELRYENILGCNNPAGLTRAEFRICMLIQEGRLPDETAEILHVSKSTFRSHLRKIYHKTGVSGHVSLVHLLHRSGSDVSAELQSKGLGR